MMLLSIPARINRLGSVLLLVASIVTFGALPAAASEAITVDVNKVEVIKLNRDASVVLIANPTIADVAVESERLIFIFGLEPGETNLLILDSKGNKILSKPVLVVPLLDRQVTVNRASANEEATYTCAPRCAAVATPAGTGAEIQSTGSSAGGSGSGSGEDDTQTDELVAATEALDAYNEGEDARNDSLNQASNALSDYNQSTGQ